MISKEIEKFIIRQPPKGEKDDYDSENSWISDGLPSSSRFKTVLVILVREQSQFLARNTTTCVYA